MFCNFLLYNFLNPIKKGGEIMSQQYYFNKFSDKNNKHEVHTASCSYLPLNKIYLGRFSNCKDAIKEAKALYPFLEYDGCYHCSNECHTV